MAAAEILAVKKEIAEVEFQQKTGEPEVEQKLGEEPVTAVVTETPSTEESDSGVDNSGSSNSEMATSAETPVVQTTVVDVTQPAENLVTMAAASPFQVLPANYQLLLQQQYINFLHLQQSLLQVSWLYCTQNGQALISGV